jgi:hypothetical protein
MKFRSFQIQTPLKELQVGSNQGRSGILGCAWYQDWWQGPYQSGKS